MNLAEILARHRGLGSDDRVASAQWDFAADWARNAPWLILAGCLLLPAMVGLLYARRQPRGRPLAKAALAACRGTLLCLMLVALAEPVLRLSIQSDRRPLVWLLFDGTESMAIEDELTAAEAKRLVAALDLETAELPPETAATGRTPSKRASRRFARIDLLRTWLAHRGRDALRNLQERFKLEAFIFSRADRVDRLSPTSEATGDDVGAWARGLSANGQVTDLGNALADLARQPGASDLAGVIVFSDFDQNAGPAAEEAAGRLGAPVFTVGIGPLTAVNLSVTLETQSVLKRAERARPRVVLRQTGLDAQTVDVRLTARRPGPSTAEQNEITIGRQTVELDGPATTVEFPYVPNESGRWLLTVQADLAGREANGEQYRTEREIEIRDDYLRLLCVEYEPDWEWRSLRELFRRDPLVGPDGFRTFLRSADPQVRRAGGPFLASLTPTRGDFFANSVIVLGDMPATSLNTRFCELVKELVGRFGGGLVVLAGPRFGPGQLADTPLAEMLPVVVEPGQTARGDRRFELRLTPQAAETDFMRLGDGQAESEAAWRNLGPLAWYQPVTRVLGTVLAEHPSDVCADGRTPQPLIAIGRYGEGEVVYLGFNETWRLRRKFGDRDYGRFWGGMIHRLASSHASRAQRRLIVRTDRPQYQSGDQVLLRIEVYDENFEPLDTTSDGFPLVSAEWIVPAGTAGNPRVEPLSIAAAGRGVYEARLDALAAGEHRLNVRDPMTGDYFETRFHVTATSPERRSLARNARLASELAAATGGKSYDLATAADVVDKLHQPAACETRLEVVPLWNTWPVFLLAVGLMLGEWGARRRMNLP